ncbi:MAG: IPT/TIG domain-containing protein [Acidimicrobiales bacterium]
MENLRILVQVMLTSVTMISAIIATTTLGVPRAAAQGTGSLVFGAPAQVDHQPPWSTVNSFSDISCPSASLCVAVDTAGHLVTSTDPNGGPSAWQVSNLTQAGLDLTGISCPSASLCVAVDANSDIITSTDPVGGPQAWNVTGGLLDPSFPAYVSCPSITFCVAVDANNKVAYSTDPTGGASAWTTYSTGYPGLAFDGISCASSTLCVGIDSSSEVVVSTDPTAPAQLGGSGPGDWSETTVDSGNVLSSIWCESTSLCAAVDSQGNVLSSANPTGGASAWSIASIDGTTALLGITCSSASLCAAVDSQGNVLVSTSPTGGAPAWTTSDIDGTNQITAISCPSNALCVSVDSKGNVASTISPDGGPSSWTTATVDDTDWLSGISCPSTALCVGVDHSGNVVTSTDPTGGAPNWTVARVDTVGKLMAVACPSTSLCVAVDDTSHIFTSTDPTGGAAAWTLTDESGSLVVGFYGISCATDSACLAVGGDGGGLITTDPTGGPGAWSYVRVGPGSAQTSRGNVGGGEMITGAWCSLDLCVTIDDAGGIETAASPFANIGPNQCYDPSTEKNDLNGPCFVPYTLSSGAILEGISCSSSSFCAVVDDLGNVWTSLKPSAGASSWQAASIDPAHFLNAVTCPSSSFCLAVDNVGQAFASDAPTGGASTWAATDVDGVNNALSGADCLSNSSCVLVDTIGNVIPGGVPTAPSVTSVIPSSGSTTGGTSVDVFGSGFEESGSVSEVMFGSTPASSFTVDSDTEITALSPPEPVGTVDITATNSIGASARSSSDEFTFAPPPTPASYVPMSPVRICDTRAGQPQPGCPGATALGPGGILSVQVAGIDGVPSSAVTSVTLNVTATKATAASYLTFYPASSARPSSSNLNFPAGKTVSNLATVELSSQGALDVYNNAGTVDVIVDVQGYYSTSSAQGAGLYNPLSPARICDTRSGNPSGLEGTTLSQCEGIAPSPGTDLTIQVAGLGGVPSSGAAAAVLNVTAVGAAAAGYLTVYPAGGHVPLASNVNYSARAVVANRVTVPLSTSGQVSIFSYEGTPNIIVDVSGWFSAGGSSSTGDKFTPAFAPTRICDTRTGVAYTTECTGNTLASDGSLAVAIAGVDGVPSNVTAVVLNVTVTSTSTNSYLSVYPCGSPQPTISDLNWTPGATVPNLVVATIGAGGEITVFNHSGSAALVVDVIGWYS